MFGNENTKKIIQATAMIMGSSLSAKPWSSLKGNDDEEMNENRLK